MKNKLLLAIATSLIAGPAMAQSAFEGFNFQVGTGYNSYSPKISDVAGAYTISADTATNIALRAGLGYTAALGNNFNLGGLIEYDFINSKNALVNFQNNNVKSDSGTLNSQQKNKITFSVLPGIEINQTTMAYAKLGYSTFKTELTDGYGGTSQQQQGSYNFGLGFKKLIDKNIYVFGEGNFSTFADKSDASINYGGKSYNLILGLGYKF